MTLQQSEAPHGMKQGLKAGETICYCSRKRKIFVGSALFAVYRVLVVLSTLGVMIAVALDGVPVLVAMFAIGLLFYIWLEFTFYTSYKKKMLADRHTEQCSRKIALAGMLKSSMYYPFRIIDEDK